MPAAALTLEVRSFHRLSPAQEASVTLEHGEMTIGRSPKCGWVLPDPDRILSNLHCTVSCEGGTCRLTDTSTNGVFVNGSEDAVGKGNSIELHDGDALRMGEYEIAVSIREGAPKAAATDSGETSGIAAPDFAFPSEPDEKPVTAAPADGEEDTPPMAAKSGAVQEEQGVGDDFLEDPFDDPFDDEAPEFGSARQATPDPEFSAASEHISPEQQFFQPPEPAGATGELIPSDWDDDLAAETGTPDEAPAGGSAPVAAPARRPVAEGGSGEAALQAFLSGAELENLEISDADATELMETVGAMFREMIRGMMEVLAARSSLKSEFRLSQTVIRPVENNPLKFSLGVDDAIENMLTGRGPGFLPPVQAVQAGFDDIRAHQIAVLAGMQVALQALLRRFDPEALEKRLLEGSLVDSILPGKKKAKYWEIFKVLYNEVAGEAEDDFHSLFGREFARAYEEQIDAGIGAEKKKA